MVMGNDQTKGSSTGKSINLDRTSDNGIIILAVHNNAIQRADRTITIVSQKTNFLFFGVAVGPLVAFVQGPLANYFILRLWKGEQTWRIGTAETNYLCDQNLRIFRRGALKE